MTKRERVAAALAGDPVDRPPVALWGHDPPREWTARDLATSTLESYRTHDWDFIKLNPRATYFAEAWGSRYEPGPGNGRPHLVQPGVREASDLERLAPIDPRGGVLGEQLEALGMVVDEAGDEVDVLHTIFSPLGVAGSLCERPGRFAEIALEDAAVAHAALAALAETLAGVALAALERGASGVFYAPLRWASRDQSVDTFYREFGRPYDLQILARVREARFNVLHVCGEHNMLDLLTDYPVSAFNWADRGAGNPSLSEVRSRTAATVIGGVDHVRLPEMSADEIAAQVRGAVAAGPARVMIGPGCSVPPETSAERRAAVADAVRAAARS